MKAKKFCIIALVLAIVLLIMPISEIRAEEELDVKTSGDYEYYILDDGTACIIRYNGEDAKVIVPEKLDEISVTGIRDGAFFNCSNLTEITIPDSVKKIAYNPFIGCENLLNINISADHPTFAFIDNILIYKPEKKIVSYLCASEESKYEIPEGIETIGDDAFSWSINLTEVKIPDSVQSIGNSAFFKCTNLTEIEIPDSVQSIGDFGFLWCENLTEINIPDSIQSIGDSAFYGCDNLKKIKIPTSVKTIGKEAFKDCKNLTATVEKGSFAEKYCKENNIKYILE